MPSRLFGTYLAVIVNNNESQIIADLPQECSNVLRSFHHDSNVNSKADDFKQFPANVSEQKSYS